MWVLQIVYSRAKTYETSADLQRDIRWEPLLAASGTPFLTAVNQAGMLLALCKSRQVDWGPLFHQSLTAAPIGLGCLHWNPMPGLLCGAISVNWCHPLTKGVLAAPVHPTTTEQPVLFPGCTLVMSLL